MNLLIVDDQYRVVEGMLRGIRWENLGITQVYKALNAFTAKEIFKQYEISIVLCDIEMPGENGLELIRWIKKQEKPVECIVLTAHADFAYAQDAVKLGCFDYVLQPASYQTIEECVKRAILEVKAGAQKEELEHMGTVYKKQETSLVRASLRNHLMENSVASQLTTLHSRSRVPGIQQAVYLMLIQIVRWNDTALWSPRLLSDTMENIASEIFETNHLDTSVVAVEYPCFAMFVWGEELPDEEIMFCQLQFINSIFQQFIKCKITIYMGEAVSMLQAPIKWRQLLNVRDDNVSLSNGVSISRPSHQKDISYRIPEIRRWSELLKDGYAKAVEEDAGQCLDRLMESNMLNREVLRNFYLDFLQAVYYATEHGEGVLRELFSTQEEFQLYNEGMRSVEQMKALIHYIVLRFDNKGFDEEPKQLVDEVIKYITDHVSEQIRREAVANHVHLNADYLTRIFKKETGMTLKEFIIETKMKEAQVLLRTTQLPISIISARVGYSNFSHFSYSYKKVMGVTPQDERIANQEG